MFSFPVFDSAFYLVAAPVLILVAGSLVALMQSVFKPISGQGAVELVTTGSIAAALLAGLAMPGSLQDFVAGALLSGALSRFGVILILAVALVVCLMMREHHIAKAFFRGEVASIFLMLLSGMLVMVASDDVVTLFVGLELASIGLYVVLGYIQPNRRSQEGAIKYFILGSVGAAILLFGFALLYAACGTLRLSEMVAALPAVANHGWAQLGGMLVLAGIGFKMALVPFHMWAPDAYESAPTGITAFMATTVKVMVLVVALRMFTAAAVSMDDVWQPGFIVLAALSMIVGNVMALVQTNLKRMLAYSSIAHSGYMAVAIVALSAAGATLPVRAILFYLLTYVIVSLGAFGVLMALETAENDQLTVDDLSGLSKKSPWVALALTVFMFSFGGMPPTAGFIGKFFVFNAALNNHLYGLVVVGVIGSSISLFYYLRLVVRMYMGESAGAPFGAIRPVSRIFSVNSGVMAFAVIATILLGTVLPGVAMERLNRAATEVARK
ncbi:MAG: hypothetical protein RIQ81_136 [Pseudomonadota bacterium]